MKTRFNYLLLVLLFVAGVLTSCDTETIDGYLDNYMDDYLEENNEDDEESSVEDEEEGSEDESSEEDEDESSDESLNDEELYEVDFDTYYLTKAVTPNDAIFSSAIYLTYYDAISIFEYHNAYGEATDYSASYGREKLWDWTYSSASSSSMEYYTGAETDAVGNASSLSANRTISIDLGHEYRLTNFIFYQTASQSSGTARMFAENNLKRFNLYGLGNEAMVDNYDSMTTTTSPYTSNKESVSVTRIADEYISATKIKDEYLKTSYINLSDPTSTDYQYYIIPDLSNWNTLVYDATATTQSGSEVATEDDINYAIAYGHNFTIRFEEPIRFIRIQLIENWSGDNTYFEMSEIDLIGSAVDESGEFIENPFPIMD